MKDKEIFSKILNEALESYPDLKKTLNESKDSRAAVIMRKFGRENQEIYTQTLNEIKLIPKKLDAIRKNEEFITITTNNGYFMGYIDEDKDEVSFTFSPLLRSYFKDNNIPYEISIDPSLTIVVPLAYFNVKNSIDEIKIIKDKIEAEKIDNKGHIAFMIKGWMLKGYIKGDKVLLHDTYGHLASILNKANIPYSIITYDYFENFAIPIYMFNIKDEINEIKLIPKKIEAKEYINRDNDIDLKVKIYNEWYRIGRENKNIVYLLSDNDDKEIVESFLKKYDIPFKISDNNWDLDIEISSIYFNIERLSPEEKEKHGLDEIKLIPKKIDITHNKLFGPNYWDFSLGGIKAIGTIRSKLGIMRIHNGNGYGNINLLKNKLKELSIPFTVPNTIPGGIEISLVYFNLNPEQQELN